MMHLVKGTEVNSPESVRFPVYLARSHAEFNFCSGCRCQKLNFLQIFLIFSLLLVLDFPINSF